MAIIVDTYINRTCIEHHYSPNRFAIVTRVRLL